MTETIVATVLHLLHIRLVVSYIVQDYNLPGEECSSL